MTLLKQTTVTTRADDSLTGAGKEDDDLQTDCCTFSLTSGSLEKDLRTLTLSDSKSGKIEHHEHSCESGIESLSASCSIQSACTDRSDLPPKQIDLCSMKQGSTPSSWADQRCSTRDETSLPDSKTVQCHVPAREEEERTQTGSSKGKDKGSPTRSRVRDDMCESFPDKDGDTLLHLAVLQTVTHLAHLVRVLGLRGQVNRRNRLYQTPLHLAVLTANGGALTFLMGLPGASLHLQDCRGNTPLHTACLRNDAQALRLLLLLEDVGGDVGSGGGGGRRCEGGSGSGGEEEAGPDQRPEGMTSHSSSSSMSSPSSSGSGRCQQNDYSKGVKSSGSGCPVENGLSKDTLTPRGVSSEILRNEREEGPLESLSLKETKDERVDGCSSSKSVDSRQRKETEDTSVNDDDEDDDGGETVCGDDGETDGVQEEEEDWERRRRRQEREVKIALCLKNYEGFTCLHLAMLHGNPQLVALLLRHGADVNARDGKSGRTALHLAVDTPHPSSPVLSTLLLHPGLHINATNFAQQTALQLARGRYHLDLVDLLHMRGARWSDSLHGGYYSSSGSDSVSDEDVEEDLFVPYDDLRVAGQLLTARCQV